MSETYQVRVEAFEVSEDGEHSGIPFTESLVAEFEEKQSAIDLAALLSDQGDELALALRNAESDNNLLKQALVSCITSSQAYCMAATPNAMENVRRRLEAINMTVKEALGRLTMENRTKKETPHE